MNLIFKERDFGDAVITPDVVYVVQSYSFHALGGPNQATVQAYGTKTALWELLNWLRAPVEIVNDAGTAVWWGYVAEVTISFNAIEIGVSIGSMYNRVNVVYSYIEPGAAAIGTRADTGWAQDDESVSAYGTRELRHSLSGDTPESAEQARDTLLEVLKLPQAVLMPSYGRSQLNARLTLRGWWATLGWTYFSRAAFEESLTDVEASDQEMGAASGNEKVAQSFQISEAWDAYSIKVKLRTEGSPSDNVTAQLCEDNSGSPGTVLDSDTVASSSIGATLDWVTFTLSAPAALSASTTYWVVISRSGAVDGTNYYVTGVDEALGYASGVFRLYDGASWVARGTDADMLFQVTGVEETTIQIEAMANDEGQFLVGVEIEDASGVYTSPYRDGDATALAEIASLLQRGTMNNRRLLAEVRQDRYLRVYEEAAKSESAITLFMDDAGVLYAKWNSEPLSEDAPPVGQWCQFVDLPDTVNAGLLVDPSVFFVEYAEFRVDSQAWVSITPRGAPTPWELAQITDG